MGGKKTNAPERKLALPPLLLEVSAGYKSAVDLYSPGKLAETLGKMIESGAKPAYAILLLSGIITFFLAFATSLESVYLVNYASDMISDVSGIPQPRLDLDSLVPVVVFQLILYLPVSIAATIISEALSFGIIKATGGAGKFMTQLYVASVIALSVSFGGVLSLFILLPCLQIIAGLGLLAVTLYFMLYVSARAYSAIHGISMLHAGIVVILLAIPRLAVLAFMTNWLAALMGLPAPIVLPEGV
jgi:hypothetical protein